MSLACSTDCSRVPSTCIQCRGPVSSIYKNGEWWYYQTVLTLPGGSKRKVQTSLKTKDRKEGHGKLLQSFARLPIDKLRPRPRWVEASHDVTVAEHQTPTTSNSRCTI
jgi:hypothetical protein